MKILEQIDGKVLGLGLALPGVVDALNSEVVDCWTHSLTNYSFSRGNIGTI